MNKILPVLLLILWEALSIYAEMYVAWANTENSASLNTWSITIFLITLAGIMLVSGYYLGYKAFNDIWIISVVSMTTILIIEPILAFMLFKELPSKGTLIGFFLWSAWLFATIYR